MSFDRKQRFSIRKYSVGVASVLIGTILAGTTIASADTEVKVDEASSSSTSVAPESPVKEAASVSNTENVSTYTAEPAISSPNLNPVEKNEEALASEKTTEAPAKEVAEVEKKANVVEAKTEAKVEETKKEAKVDTKVEEAKEESKSIPTVEDAESKAVVSEKAEEKASETATPSVKDKIVVDKKVPGLDLENATVNPNGGYDIQLTKEAQEKFRTSLEAYIAHRRNYNRRGSFRAAGDATSTDPDYEFKKVMTPVLPGFYADKASIEALVVDPTNIDDYVFNVWYKKLGYVTYVDEQGNYITPAGEVTSKQEESARNQYANDPSDPTRAWFTNVPSVPTGWEIKPGQSIYGYDETRKTVNPNHKDDLDAIGRDTKIVITKQIQKAIIKYVNEKGNTELSRDLVSGKSGELINYSTNDKISSYRRQGYELVSDGFSDAADKNFDSDTKVDQEFTVTLRERIEPIDPDKPKPNPDQPVDPKDPDTPKWPDPVKDVVNKDDVTRTVKYVYEDGSKAKDDVTETLHFKRFAYVNLVTGHIDYREWTTSDDTFDAVKSPVITGYTANKLVVPEVKGVKAGAADVEEVVTYVKDAQKAIIKYVNEKGTAELSRDEVNGKSGEAIDYSTADKIAAYKRKGYELVSDGFTSAANKNFDFDAKVDQEFTVTLRERIEPIDPDKPKPNPDQPVDPKDPDTPKWPDPVKDVVNKDDVTRTVKYVYEDGSKAKDDVTETLHFKRFAYVNLVTGHIDYREWTTSDDTFDAVKSPVITGYTANKLVVPEVKGVKAGAADVEEVVTYVKDAQKAIIKYVNEKGTAELSRDEVNGKSGEAIDYSTADKISAYKRKGYELVSDGFTSAANKNFDFDAKVDQEFTVVVRERIVPVGPNDPNPTPDTPYDPTDPKTPNWPKTVDKIQPRRITGTRTVNYYVEDGDGVLVPKPVRERVVFERIVLVNLVTGEMTPQAWKFVSATPIEDDAANRPAVRTRRALTDAIAPRGVEASLASDTPRFRARSARLEDEETEVTALAADVSSNSEAVLPPIPSPVVPGHYTLVKEIESTTFDPDGTLNYKFDVYYKKLGRIQLVDKDGKVLSEVVYKNNLTDASRADVTPVPEIPAAYKIKDGQKVFGYDTTAGTVDPNDPADPNAIGRNTTIVVEQKSVARQETKVVTETIFYKDALTGEVLAPEHKDQVTFHREVVVNPVTNEVLSTGEWTAENADTTFDAVTSPVLEGYTANPLVVEEVTGLTAESKDVVATVLYTKNPAPTPEPKPEPQPQPQPQPRPQPQPQPEPVKPEPVKPQPVKQEPAKPEAPVTPQAPALPETGEEQSASAALLGAAFGLVGLAGLARRKKNED